MSAVKDRAANREKRMSIGAHLIELRKRLFISAASIVVGAALGWWLTDVAVWDAIQAPVDAVAEAQGSSSAIIFPTISSAFDLRLQVAFTLGIVLASPVFYVGALGSRKTHASRLERLQASGIRDEQLARIRSPIGLDIRAQTPEEIALSVMAEIVTVRRS